MSSFDNTGKIQRDFFDEMLYPRCGYERKEVLTGPRYGVDTSVIGLPGGMAMAVTSDPLSLIPSLGLRESAWLSVHLLANDMATTGLAPMYAQFVLNLPVSLSPEEFDEYWEYIHQYCKQLEVAITGGHTGQVEGQHSTIAGGGTMMLVAPKAEILTAAGGRPGDVIIVTKEAALSSAAILAMSFPDTIRNKLGEEAYHKGCDLFHDTSCLKEGLAAGNCNKTTQAVRAMHDVTEGGILGAVYELAVASGCGAWIEKGLLPQGEVSTSICTLFGIDPLCSIGAGSMIIAAVPGMEQTVMEALKNNNIKAAIVGNLTGKQNEMIVADDSSEHLFTPPPKDPYWKAFYTAIKNKWR